MLKTNRFLLLVVFALTGFGLEAQIPYGYYNATSGKTGDELKTALHNIIKGHHSVSYGGLLNAFAYTDCKPSGMLWDIYSDIEYSPSTGVCGDYEQEGDCWNREHTWPQSWFNENTTPRCDLFHVYPTDGYVNGRRSNYPYGEVNNPIYTSGNGSKLGSCKSSLGYSGTVFEPIDEYKGDIARSYFYMSVRYYSEDDDWGTSGMTNKSEIKPWAMTMLLRWSDEDPVSQKEIDRNNAVYGYQNNRNPFIDHPEYARMIWDENWQGGTSYTITCATGLSNGSVSAPESAVEGSTVSITATPAAGYMVDTYSVYKTGDSSTTITVNSNGTFTMPNYAVTVSATFKVNNTYYNITLGNINHGSISSSVTSAKSGTTINLTATPATGYQLYSWYVFKTGDMNTTVTVTGNSFVMPAFNVTVMATFTQPFDYSYVKVISAPSDWSGEYLIVYETGGKAFNGGLITLDATGNTISVSISNNTIPANNTTNAAKFTIAPMTGGYSIQAASGKYIGNGSNSNSLTSSDNPMVNTLAFDNGDIDIVSSGGAYLRYNTNDPRFRYYKSGTYTNQAAIQLYKKVGNAATPTHTINFMPNGGDGSMNPQTVNEFEATSLNSCTFTRQNYQFDGWNTEADGSGTYYVDETTVTLLEDLILYAQWIPQYSITINGVEHGSISANVVQAIEEQTITLSAEPEEAYHLYSWTITDSNGNTVDVIENQFEMPASNVTVSATFVYVGVFNGFYRLVTSESQLQAGKTYLIVNVANCMALGTTQNTNNRAAMSVTINNNKINTISNTVCELSLGGTSGSWTFFDVNWNGTGGYLYAASSTANQLKTQAENNDNGKWTINIGNNGIATITAQGTNTHNTIKFNTNNGTPIFSCYSSGQQDVCLFVREDPIMTQQTITLSAGWNWWSPNIDITLTHLEEVLGANGIKITSHDGKSASNSSHGWNGTLTAIEVGTMYKIKTGEACTITLFGTIVNSADHAITLDYGSNWIGFVGMESLGLSGALQNLTPSNLDNIKTVGGMATYYQGIGWRGSLTTLEPGKGYIYKSNATSTKTFVFP